jgi:hypothetical protein
VRRLHCRAASESIGFACIFPYMGRSARRLRAKPVTM